MDIEFEFEFEFECPNCETVNTEENCFENEGIKCTNCGLIFYPDSLEG
jgi:rubredoxin